MENNPFRKWTIWLLAALFYFYEYLLNVSPGAMVPELVAAFGVNASSLGVLSSFYFYAYAPMQLPVGFLVDKFGARKLLAFASLACAGGTFLFSVSKNILPAYLGRLSTGVGSSFAFVAMVYICTRWFKKSRRALLVGLANSVGMLGAACGGGPLTLFIQATGWRSALAILGFAGLFFSLTFFLLYFLYPSKEGSPNLPSSSSFLKNISLFYKNPQSRWNALAALCYYMTTTALGGLWGIPFIQQAYGVSKEVAGFAMSMIFIGWLVGGPIVGAVSDYKDKRKKILIINIFMTLLFLLPVLYCTFLPIYVVYICVFFIGFFSSGELLSFTFAAEINPSHIKGVSIACTNFSVALGGVFIQPLIGFFLDFFRSVSLHETGYTTLDYQLALSLLPFFLLVAGVLASFLKEQKRGAH